MSTQICIGCLNDLPIEEFDYYVVRTYDQYNECRVCREQRLIEDRMRREQYKKDNFELYVFREYQQSAKKRELDFTLTLEQLTQFIKSECFYCGHIPEFENYERSGLDRVDSAQGYILENIVACCSRCNYAKQTMSVDEFFGMCKAIVIRHCLI